MSKGQLALAAVFASEAEGIGLQVKSLTERAMKIPSVAPILDSLWEVGFETDYLALWQDEVTLSYHSVDSFKKFEKFFQVLTSFGYELEYWKSTKTGPEVLYHHPGGPVPFTVRLNGTRELCEQVQVGMEMKEIPVYEWHCKEDLPTEYKEPEVIL